MTAEPGGGTKRWRLIVGTMFVSLGALSFLLSSIFMDGQTLLAWLQQLREYWQAHVTRQPMLSSVIYFIIYVLFAASALPGAMVLTLAGGALFGWIWGVVLVSCASTTGATLAMLLSRTLLRSWVRQRYSKQLQVIQEELDRAGGWYLLSLRLNPVVPFFLINLAFGLTKMSVWRFWSLSQIGMLPATLIYVWAGTELDHAVATGRIVQPRLLLALLALSLLPLLLRWWTRLPKCRTQPPTGFV
ncbi:MAG: TVP38/TMEM64 family protein [Gemmatales bacterium]|nr:TVP38/TMEM64 family protein [Gemmatales bacterium]MCS7159409.1 TVP38/TMEM64 family protein [Gemmatales bacterium]MDW8174608.1 TVP38/TMEM64 family protein [Gemmatales bacterium]MDW8222754.1 TVP38/TMEM64 family protein [Gemmatales bacterium]